jgi:beta-galactosidase
MPLDRRTFLQTGTACLTGLALERSGIAEDRARIRESGRLVLPLNQNWRFSRGEGSRMVAPDYDDSGFERVTLPHSNVMLPWHDFDQQSYQYVSVYRNELQLPKNVGKRRVYLDFQGAMTASTIWLNGANVGGYKGGYTPFSFDLTSFLDTGGRNLLAVEVDSRELPEIPPFGYEIDFLTFGGMYREASLRLVPTIHIENIFAQPSGVIDGIASLETVVFRSQLEQASRGLSLEVLLLDKDRVVGQSKIMLPAIVETAEPVAYKVSVPSLTGIAAWELDSPKLYRVCVRLLANGSVLDEESRKVGFRSAQFTERGFELNGRVVKIRGLNRHQTYPYAGGAMPARVQRKDAQILKYELKCNMVRTSHYPQSPHFLDACDEIGLLVLEEIPGWQHIGNSAWQDLVVDNVRRMIRRDWSRPSIVLWSIRINESHDDHELYTRTNGLARELDPTRQTIGVRNFQDSEFLEDVFGMNDFAFPLKTPNHAHYLNTEFVGAEWPTRASDNNAIQREHVLRYARIYNQLNSTSAYAGGLGWCAFDYNTHADFGAGDHVCYMGVMDMFREPKAAAGLFKSQCDPSEEIVLEPAFHFAENDEPGEFRDEVICSNCDSLRCFIKPLGANGAADFHPIVELKPAYDQFPHLAHPPFFLSLPNDNDDWGDLRIDGYLRGQHVISKTLSGSGVDRKLVAFADDPQLQADGADATRVVLRITDEYGNVQRLCGDPLELSLSGPATLIGPRVISLSGGKLAVWIRTKHEPGIARLVVTHQTLGAKEVEIQIHAAIHRSGDAFRSGAILIGSHATNLKNLGGIS